MPESPFSVLVVDDSEDYRSLLCLYLKKIPCVISEARDGEEAVDICGETRFDLIVMDVIMPLMDGVDAIAAIRQLEAAAGTPRTAILALSGEDSEETGQECLEAGADRMLIKPISKELFISTAKEMLGEVVLSV